MSNIYLVMEPGCKPGVQSWKLLGSVLQVYFHWFSQHQGKIQVWRDLWKLPEITSCSKHIGEADQDSAHHKVQVLQHLASVTKSCCLRGPFSLCELPISSSSIKQEFPVHSRSYANLLGKRTLDLRICLKSHISISGSSSYNNHCSLKCITTTKPREL